MARIKRIVIPNIPHHVTQRGVRSMNIFFKDEDYTYYKQLLLSQCQLYDLEVISYCLMTNHIHLIVIPKSRESLSKAIGETHRLYTRKINFEQKVKGHLFQERFYSTPLDAEHLLHALRYVEQNPVKAYMVKYAWDYKYSSARHRLDLKKENELLSDYEAIDNITNYKEFLQQNIQTKFIQEKTRTGKPCGNEEFYDKIQLLTGVDYKKKKTGPKRKINII
ncbi:transposase [Sulfurospirillum arcachonense]|uniref:transposase n=1 Tax=Sulfurospirillum arcachonense TaxID=57666 RepID=UPI0004680860|nr:transposase [Sulfurospirillum arcachonense]